MSKSQKLSQGFLSLAPEDLRDAFSDAALERRISPVIMEKDFWVCWLLQRLFNDPEIEPHLVFKEQTFEEIASRTGRDKALAEMQLGCGEALEKRIMPRVEKSIRAMLGKPRFGDQWLYYEFDDRVHSPIVYFKYPATFPDGLDYIRRDVKLEIGSLTDQRPLGRHSVRPWIAEAFPGFFTDWICQVTALELSRTFWEKATILHAEHHRPDGQDMPVRQSRHFSDFANLLHHAEAKTFLADWPMCRRVAEWKARVFARKWARYDLARPGTFRLVPPISRLAALEKDYDAMRPMFLGDPLPFEEMLRRLQDAEERMNAP